MWAGAFAGLAALLFLPGCGAAPSASGGGSNGFAMLSPAQSESLAGPEAAAALAELTLAETRVVGGTSTIVTVILTQPAPAAGVRILLTASDPGVVHIPSSLVFKSGQSSLSFSASTLAVTAAVSVTVRAQTEGSTVGANLSVFPPAPALSTLTVQPPPVLALTVAASDEIEPTAATTNLDLSGNNNPNAKFKGCWYRTKGRRYQAVDVTVGTPGTYAFNAILYHGTTCNANDFADQFGFGELLKFGGFGYTFWFTDFANQTDMSALWYVGDENSKCINYLTAPNC
jgi:hypothetical protein